MLSNPAGRGFCLHFPPLGSTMHPKSPLRQPLSPFSPHFFSPPDPGTGPGSRNQPKVLKVALPEGRYLSVLLRRPTSSRVPRSFRATAALMALLVVGTPLATLIVSPVTPAVASSVRPSSFPRLGDRGESVRALQRALIAAGITVRGGADGYFGASTAKALTTFQTSKGLIASGEIDPSTAFLLGLGPSPVFAKRGDRGGSVITLQNALIAAGVTVRGGVDGVFGAGTASAIASFQSARGFAATGIIDITTAIALGIAPASATANNGAVTTTPATTVPPTTTPATTTPATTIPATTTPAATTPASTTPALVTLGSNGPAVVTLQNALIAAGIPVRGGADGAFGRATANAISAYQRAISVMATGQLDIVTAQFLGLVAAPALPAFGDRGPAVVDLQNKLIASGIVVKGGADGAFGVATRISLRTFQTARRIPVTGTVDLRTALHLGIIPGLVTSQPPTSDSATTTVPASTVPVTTTSISVFPVLGPCWFSDTWQVPRAGGRRHEGVDIIARTGQPLYAVVDGTITRQFFDRPGSLGGNALRLTAADGTYFHYAHLSAFAEGIGVDSTVVAGQVIGYVGSTGSSSAPHLHFEYHPGGGAAVNPYPIVKSVDGCRSTTPPPSATTSTTTTTVAPA